MRARVLLMSGAVACGPLYAEDLEGLWVHVQDRQVEAIEFEGGDEGLVVLDRPYRLWRYPLNAEDTQEVQRGVYEVIPRRYRDSTLIRTVEWDVDYTLIDTEIQHLVVGASSRELEILLNPETEETRLYEAAQELP